jgi:DNA polymerase
MTKPTLAPQISQVNKETKETRLSRLNKTVSQCTLCSLSQSRTQTVFSDGNPHAQLMIIGEAPGQKEDLQGKPFVGRSGQLLTKMLQAIGLSRETVYIANIVKCRPPNNRPPSDLEIKTCIGYLHLQIALVNPALILLLGATAVKGLLGLGIKKPLNSLRGEFLPFTPLKNFHKPIPTLVSFHPAYLLRNSSKKPSAARDLLQVAQFLNLPIQKVNEF